MKRESFEVPTEWTFETSAVARGFDRHVREQLPWYELVTGAVTHIARHYIPENGLIYDVGASTGNIGKALAETLAARNAVMIGIEKSAEMAKLWSGPGEVRVADALDFEFESYDVAVCFLVMMFLPPARRAAWLRNLVGKCRPGGAVIVVDKIESSGDYLGTVLHRLTIAGKVATGTPSRDIVAKELSLAGIQRPLPASFFSFVTPAAHPFFRFGEFAGFVIEGGPA